MNSKSDHDVGSLPAWAQRSLVMQIFAQARALGGEARIVGGAVRDWLAGYPVGDIDMAVNLPSKLWQAICWPAICALLKPA